MNGSTARVTTGRFSVVTYCGLVSPATREVSPATSDDRFNQPRYSVSRAARLVGMSPSTLSTWAVGTSDISKVVDRCVRDPSSLRSTPRVWAVRPFPSSGSSKRRSCRHFDVPGCRCSGPGAHSRCLPRAGRSIMHSRLAVSTPTARRCGGAPYSAVESRARAGEPLDSIARDYDVPMADISEALHALAPSTLAA